MHLYCALHAMQAGQDGGWMPPGMTPEEAHKDSGQGATGGTAPEAGADRVGLGHRVAAAVPTVLAVEEAAHKAPATIASCPATKGFLGTSGRTGDVGLLPGSRWAEYKRPTPTLTRSPGANAAEGFRIHAVHLKERACKGGAPACSNFSVAAP